MPRYAITSKAGPFVAGYNNVGAGTVLLLSEAQAQYEVALGTLVLVPDEAAPEPEPAPALPPLPADLTKLTKAQLLDLAAARGVLIAADPRDTKAEIIAALLA